MRVLARGKQEGQRKEGGGTSPENQAESQGTRAPPGAGKGRKHVLPGASRKSGPAHTLIFASKTHFRLPASRAVREHARVVFKVLGLCSLLTGAMGDCAGEKHPYCSAGASGLRPQGPGLFTAPTDPALT